MYVRCISGGILIRDKTLIELIDFGLQVIIDYLTYLHWHIQRRVLQPIQLNFDKDNYEIDETTDNYNLSDYEHRCPRHRYTIRIIERNPLLIYIEQFLTPNEIQHIIELTEPILRPSTFYDDDDRIEPLQVVKYTPEQQFKAHYDWFSQTDLTKNGGQRISTFFTYLQANCTLGETEFLDIPFNLLLHERFCDILICDRKSLESGIRFRPIVGNSVFWFNVDEQGTVDYLTYHAGRPPGENGHKIGLNTWTHEDIFTPS
ncbi:hypothetical protein I4U23_006032 [Adineta vaga]|nr:hypothetical protein I4U23_006032 [Adineta vaga]